MPASPPRERKRRTRRLILIGSVIKKMADRDSRTQLWLLHALHQDLERTQDRELFDLDPKPENGKAPPETPPPKPPPPLPGWRPHHLKTGAWGSIYLGDTSTLTPELVGTRITVQSKDGQSWTTTVTAVLDRSSEQVIVTNSGRPEDTLSQTRNEDPEILVRQAAEQGDASTQYTLGLGYANGRGVVQDYVQAHKWINLAASRTYRRSAGLPTRERRTGKADDCFTSRQSPALGAGMATEKPGNYL